ncbi:hypothetical protein N0V82_001487 [Gnomoniopsis sp. IMI 355080]|nr:hypothetical protein N0V82_001487 [Gnomoniopsis sp. IMI 355080]
MTITAPRGAYDKVQHESQADAYKQRESFPKDLLESQLQDFALGNCTGLTVLDIGGGQGLRARQAIDHGAVAVDVVDLSPEMMRTGEKIEQSLGRGDSIVRWFEADVSKPDEVARLPLRFKEEGYDIVMGNWIFDHASNMEMLDGMFQSIVAYLKPGGLFVGTRVFNTPRAPATSNPKYGAVYKDIAEIPGGMFFRYVVNVDPPATFDAATMEATYNPSKVEETHARYGLVDTKIVPWEDTDCVKTDPEFWKEFLELPNLAVVTARKTG